MSAAEKRRLFFALWPDAAGAEQLSRAALTAHAVCRGRVMHRETLHLTLAFLGDVPEADLAPLLAMAAGVSGEAHELNFDRLGKRRRQRIVWAACSATPPQLAALVLALQQGLRGMGLTIEERAFAPHVTLLRNAREADLGSLPPLDPIAWPVADFVLVESQLAASGAAYRIIARWPLASLAAGERFRPPAAE